MHVKQVAVVAGEGLHNGLTMLIASYRLMCQGAKVVTFHDQLPELTSWFPELRLSPRLPIESLTPCDLIIASYDGSPYIKELIRAPKPETQLLSVFYNSHSPLHPPLTPCDRVFNKGLSIVDNISLAISSLLQARDHSKNNGLTAPQHLIHRKYERRVALPSSGKPYEILGKAIQKLGFDPLFLPKDDLSLSTALLYESGYFIGPESDLCHLASNLHIPTLVVSKSKTPLGWLKGTHFAPTPFFFVSRALSRFKALVEKSSFKCSC